MCGCSFTGEVRTHRLSIKLSLTSLSVQCLLASNQSHFLPSDNTLQCTINGWISEILLFEALINHPEIVLEKSLSIVVAYLSRWDLIQQKNSHSLSTTTSICSDQPTEYNVSTKLPLFPLTEFECVIRVQDPGMIVVYVDQFQPSTKAAEVTFPSMNMNLLYRADYDKENWLVMSLGVEFSAISFAPLFLDFLSAVMTTRSASDQIPVEETRSDVKMEEKGTVQTSPSFYEDDDYAITDKNKRMSE